jgi:hypothetical protein
MMISHARHNIIVPCDLYMHFKSPATSPLGTCGFSSLRALQAPFRPETFFTLTRGIIVIPESVSPETEAGFDSA